jgi:phosphohistidine phosphatase
MLQLTLFRHAKATPAEDEADDFERALAPSGREAAPRMAAAIRDAGAAPEIALVSDSRRTRETWELAAPVFPGVAVSFVRLLYLAPAETIYAEAERAGASRVIIVAHNPGLHDLATRLARRRNALESNLRQKFPTAAAALFSRADADASWKLDAFVTPKLLGGMYD